MADYDDEKVYPKDEFRDMYKDTDLLSCVHAMHKVRARKDKGEETMAKINAEYDVLRIEIIPKKMEDQGLEILKVKGVGRVSLTGDMYVQQKDKNGLFTWLRKSKLADLITEGVNSSTLKAFLKERIKGGKTIPPDTVIKITPYTRASITKGD
jgi:hypothetical protein